MSKELIVSTTTHETRVAVIEDDSGSRSFLPTRERIFSLPAASIRVPCHPESARHAIGLVDIGRSGCVSLLSPIFRRTNEEYEKVVSTAEDQALKLNKGGVTLIPPALPAVRACGTGIRARQPGKLPPPGGGTKRPPYRRAVRTIVAVTGGS